MATSLALVVFIVKMIGVGFFGLAVYFSKRSPIKEDQFEDED
jgi:hypothetical protein